jgi:hypothetical protein
MSPPAASGKTDGDGKPALENGLKMEKEFIEFKVLN